MEKIDLQRPVRTVEEYGYSQKPIIFKKMAYIFVNENDDNDFLIILSAKKDCTKYS